MGVRTWEMLAGDPRQGLESGRAMLLALAVLFLSTLVTERKERQMIFVTYRHGPSTLTARSHRSSPLFSARALDLIYFCYGFVPTTRSCFRVLHHKSVIDSSDSTNKFKMR
ncbi:unnamed protein product [Cyclocybe aegerita]|uniref:Uncharacterized protein n=1 Tax=Cyclocybe aegerita TaxID=1973307 RepID=A0A8S0W9Q7_CYCAE|nr:unnamed protein product [Cyclocybe aegerita]